MKTDDMESRNDCGAASASPERPLLLSEHVHWVVKDYLARLGTDEVSHLYNMVIHEVERPLIQAVMEQCGQNQSKAAHMLGLSRSTLRKKIAALDPQ